MILHVPVADNVELGDLWNEFERKVAALPYGLMIGSTSVSPNLRTEYRISCSSA